MEAPNYVEEVPSSLLRPGIDDPARCAAWHARAIPRARSWLSPGLQERACFARHRTCACACTCCKQAHFPCLPMPDPIP